MTCLNAHAVGPKVYILTDTVGYDADGLVHAWVNKVITVPHLRMAMGTRGGAGVLPDVVLAITAECPTFDDVLERAAEIIQDTYLDNMVDWHEACGTAKIDFLVAGYSERLGKTAVGFLSSIDQPHAPAFTLTVTDVVVTPAVSPDDLHDAGIMIEGMFSRRRPVVDMLQIMEMQRAEVYEVIDGEGEMRHVVGGAAIVTEISAEGVSQRIAHRWPDKIGERIQPAQAAAAMGQIRNQFGGQGLSRQQRRQAERQARRAGAHAG